MKLAYRLNFTTFAILFTVTSAIGLAGYGALTTSCYQLTSQLMTEEVQHIIYQLKEAQHILEENGISRVESYVNETQNTFLEKLKKSSPKRSGSVIVVDNKSGKALINVPENKNDKTLLKELADQYSGTLIQPYKNTSTFFAYSTYPQWGWTVLLYQDAEKVFSPRKKFVINVFLIFGISLLLGCAILVWSTNKITRPLGQLAESAKNISQGRWENTALVIKGTDEISILGKAFHKMASHLSTTYKDLQKNVMDIKKSKEALFAEKERLSTTLRSIEDCVISTDLNGDIILANKAAEKLFGQSQSQLVGKSIADQIKLDWEGEKENPITSFITSSKNTRFEKQAHYCNGSGQDYILSITAAQIISYNQLPLGMIFVFRNISDKIKMQEELIRTHKLESVGLLAGGIAHDFNNILTGILGNISLAKISIGDSATLQQKLDEAEKASKRAQGLTQQLLTFSRGGDPVKEMLLLQDVITEASNFVLSGSNCRCNYIFDKDLNPVKVDKGQISQVFHNLVLNSCQAMPSGGIIEIKCGNCDVTEEKFTFLTSCSNYVKVEISDSGTGMSKEVVAHIFDPYFTTKKDGVGLGLASAYSIITKHNGYITVKSRPGKGTVFTILLPASEKQVISTEKKGDALIKGQGRVLVMDDEEMVRKVTGTMLNALGFEVEFAEHGQEAIEKYKRAHEEEQPFDVVIMDLTIPGGMGGREATVELQKKFPDIMAIVSSGYSNDPIVANYQKYGFVDMIPKPFSIEKLSAVMSRLTQQ